ncbi:MAG: hypothetical protein KA144_04485 [Xanthomonadaceae bacterium]|nr:hypothetical protein [Xanthomonadaceae bacterium]
MTLSRRLTDAPKPLSCAPAAVLTAVLTLALSAPVSIGDAYAQSQTGQTATQSNDAAEKTEADKRREAEAAAKAEADRKAEARKPKPKKEGDKDSGRELEEEEDI